MSEREPPIRNISDTARWVAVYRARESERPDALFRDPYARRLAGDRGEQIVDAMPPEVSPAWPFVTRTVLVDRFVAREVAAGTDLVLNLAAGLDTRPYRMELPRELTWIEVDLPGLLSYKEEVLRGEQPVCRLERIPLDLASVPARRTLFARVGARGRRVLVITEGLLIYLAPEEVSALAADLHAPESFARWICDIPSPGLLDMLRKGAGAQLDAAGAPFKFGPAEGPGFFARFGWSVVEVKSMFKTAGRLGRLPFMMKLMSMLPESNGRQGKRPWSGVCLLARA